MRFCVNPVKKSENSFLVTIPKVFIDIFGWEVKNGSFVWFLDENYKLTLCFEQDLGELPQGAEVRSVIKTGNSWGSFIPQKFAAIKEWDLNNSKICFKKQGNKLIVESD